MQVAQPPAKEEIVSKPSEQQNGNTEQPAVSEEPAPGVLVPVVKQQKSLPNLRTFMIFQASQGALDKVDFVVITGHQVRAVLYETVECCS